MPEGDGSARLEERKIGEALGSAEQARRQRAVGHDRRADQRREATLNWIRYKQDDSQGRLEYLGEVSHSVPDGLGVMRWRDGTLFEGDWSQGKNNGLGRESYPTGSHFLGQFQDDTRHGLGVFLGDEKVTYFGPWHKGSQQISERVVQSPQNKR